MPAYRNHSKNLRTSESGKATVLKRRQAPEDMTDHSYEVQYHPATYPSLTKRGEAPDTIKNGHRTFTGVPGLVNSHHLHGTSFQSVPNGPHASPGQCIAFNHRGQ